MWMYITIARIQVAIRVQLAHWFEIQNSECMATYFERFSRRISQRSATSSREVLIILERAPSSTSPFLLPRFAPSSHPFPSINVCLGLKSIAGSGERPEYSLQFQLCPSMLDRTGHFSPAHSRWLGGVTFCHRLWWVVPPAGRLVSFQGFAYIRQQRRPPPPLIAMGARVAGGRWASVRPNGACRHAASKLDRGANGGVQSGWQ